MINLGILVLGLAAIALAAVAFHQGTDTFARGVKRAVEQAAQLVPRMFFALIGAGFVGKLMPSDLIAQYLGDDAGISAILVATAAGLILPAGPVVAFAIAAVLPGPTRRSPRWSPSSRRGACSRRIASSCTRSRSSGCRSCASASPRWRSPLSWPA